MSYILRVVMDFIKDSYIHADGDFSHRYFWQTIFDAAEISFSGSNSSLSDVNISRWTNGKTNLRQEYLDAIKSHKSDVIDAIDYILEKSYCDKHKLRNTISGHESFSLLGTSESSTVSTIIFDILTNHHLLKKSKQTCSRNLCAQHFPYSIDDDCILPIEDVQDQIRSLFDKYNYIIISGIPGIGKLSQVTYYIETHQYTRYYYLPFKTSLIDTINSYDFINVIGKKDKHINATPQSLFESRLGILNRSEEHTILVIDNVGRNIQNDPGFKNLTSLHIDIIFLTTCHYSTEHPANVIELPPLTKNQCIDLFYQHCLRILDSESNRFALSLLLDKINCHPLSIKLIAKLLQNGSLTIDTISEQVQQYKLIDSATLIEYDKKNRETMEDTYRNLILSIFDLEKLDDHELNVLKHVALLPATGYNRISFNSLVNDLDSNTINALYNLGWIQINQKQNTISMHHLIRSCIIDKFAPSPGFCSDFLKAYVKRIDTEEYENENEELLLGIELLTELCEDSILWFEASYMILRFLKNQKVPYAVIEFLLNKYRKISIDETLDTINHFYCRHVEIMYKLFTAQDKETCLMVYQLAEDITHFSIETDLIPSLIFIDFLCAVSNNLYELILSPATEYPRMDLELSYFKIYICFQDYMQMVDVETILDSQNSKYNIVPSSIINVLYMQNKISTLNSYPLLQAQINYSHGLTEAYKNNFENALEKLLPSYNYYQCHAKYQFNYHNLHCQYLILYCQKHLGWDFDNKIYYSLSETLNNLPNLQNRSERFQALKSDFETYILK